MAPPAGPPDAKRLSETRDQLLSLGYLNAYQPAPSQSGITVHDDRAGKGWNLYSAGSEVVLMDMAGEVKHRWAGDLLDGQMIHSVHVFPNGDLIAIAGDNSLVRLDKNSRVLWRGPERIHHEFVVLPDGEMLALRRAMRTHDRLDPPMPFWDDEIVRLDQNGKLLDGVSIYDALMRSRFPQLENFRMAALNKNAFEKGVFDPLHTNALVLLDGRLADRLPAFSAGNVLVSIAGFHTLAVIDLKKKRGGVGSVGFVGASASSARARQRSSARLRQRRQRLCVARAGSRSGDDGSRLVLRGPAEFAALFPVVRFRGTPRERPYVDRGVDGRTGGGNNVRGRRRVGIHQSAPR
ncbi:MAG: aryl-sulfate sulfotransferase [Deltaproteobacteria bacterium]|nr:aryl-sulfate sulfotransferase [Deltaproteobacteria bacterium]